MIDLPLMLDAKGNGRWKRVVCPVCGNKRAGVAEGDKGWVYNCWEGCTVHELCGTLGVNVTDLFWDELEPRPRYDFDPEIEQYVLAQAICAKRNGSPLEGGDRGRAQLAMERLKKIGLYDETVRKCYG